MPAGNGLRPRSVARSGARRTTRSRASAWQEPRRRPNKAPAVRTSARAPLRDRRSRSESELTLKPHLDEVVRSSLTPCGSSTRLRRRDGMEWRRRRSRDDRNRGAAGMGGTGGGGRHGTGGVGGMAGAGGMAGRRTGGTGGTGGSRRRAIASIRRTPAPAPSSASCARRGAALPQCLRATTRTAATGAFASRHARALTKNRPARPQSVGAQRRSVLRARQQMRRRRRLQQRVQRRDEEMPGERVCVGRSVRAVEVLRRRTAARRGRVLPAAHVVQVNVNAGFLVTGTRPARRRRRVRTDMGDSLSPTATSDLAVPHPAAAVSRSDLSRSNARATPKDVFPTCRRRRLRPTDFTSIASTRHEAGPTATGNRSS